MKDLQTREDIELLVNRFYDKVVQDPDIGGFFNDIAKVDWSLHLPKMYAFWESILFGQMTYKGNPMQKHFPINELKAIEKPHFDRWLLLWSDTISENFEGKIADMALSKAQNIASLMAYKMEMARRLA